jgi:predicted enzyme related to lactoylglutathione lyase
MKIALTGIHVKNPLQAYQFYTEVLGFIKKTYIPEHNIAIVVAPDEPDGTGLILEPNDNPVAKAYQEGLYKAGIPVMVLGTKDLEKEYQRLKKCGVLFKGAPVETEYGKQATFEDTCGNWVQLYQF